MHTVAQNDKENALTEQKPASHDNDATSENVSEEKSTGLAWHSTLRKIKTGKHMSYKLPTVSIIIPTLNEESRIVVLLECLTHQTHLANEIIVADANSTDATRIIAKKYGAKVVDGGLPPRGRNAGAAIATSDIVMFLDADSAPNLDFIELVITEFVQRSLSAAAVRIAPIEPDLLYAIACEFSNTYMWALQSISPHGSGLCLVAKRSAHLAIGGFDETLVLAEDHDYMRRISKIGRYGLLRRAVVHGSMRRFEVEGLGNLTRKYAYSEWETLRGQPIHEIPFTYVYASYDKPRHKHDHLKHKVRVRPKNRKKSIDATKVKASEQLRRLAMMIAYPSTELQADAIVAAVVAASAGGLGTAALAASGMPAQLYASVGAASATVVAAGVAEAMIKLRGEYHYGDFFMASVGIAPQDLQDVRGNILVRGGVDKVCELHVIGHIGRMAELNSSNLRGRLTITLESLQGFMMMIEDFDAQQYSDVVAITARSDLAEMLFKMGFQRIPDPPPYDFANRLYKRIFMNYLSHKVKHDRRTPPENYPMGLLVPAVLTSPEFKNIVNGQIRRAQETLAKLEARERSEKLT